MPEIWVEKSENRAKNNRDFSVQKNLVRFYFFLQVTTPLGGALSTCEIVPSDISRENFVSFLANVITN